MNCFYEMLSETSNTQTIFEDQPPQIVLQIDSLILAIILPHSNISKVKALFLEPNFRIFKDAINWKQGMNPDSFLK